LSPQVFPAQGKRRMRVALLAGCVQQPLAPEINAATIRLLTRHGCEVVVAPGAGCCGALVHHLGKDSDHAVKENVAAWMAEKERDGLDAIVVNASGCGTMLKDYGYLLRADPAWAGKAGAVSALAKDVTEVMASLGLSGAKAPEALKVAYHSACSLQHGQRIKDEPKRLLKDAGFEVREPAEAHLCCGSAGTYNLLQPEIAERLRARKAANIAHTGASVVAAGNIGCMVQIAGGLNLPVVHTVELLDWATGGPKPAKLKDVPVRGLTATDIYERADQDSERRAADALLAAQGGKDARARLHAEEERLFGQGGTDPARVERHARR
jgi:glycolate oxidase iron-sulfur subunit